MGHSWYASRFNEYISRCFSCPGDTIVAPDRATMERMQADHDATEHPNRPSIRLERNY